MIRRLTLTVNEKSRGYHKIKGASSTFNFDFRGRTVLDIGSSTGGFSEFALESGADKVIAIEKGSNQMKAPLRYDPRIELHEKTDIFDVKVGADELIQEKPDVIVADVSFVSLKNVLKYSKNNLASRNTDYLVMMKPQFEARPYQLRKGVVKNETVRREIVKEFELWLRQNGFATIKKRDNELTGKNGNKERFYWLRRSK